MNVAGFYSILFFYTFIPLHTNGKNRNGFSWLTDFKVSDVLLSLCSIVTFPFDKNAGWLLTLIVQLAG